VHAGVASTVGAAYTITASSSEYDYVTLASATPYVSSLQPFQQDYYRFFVDSQPPYLFIYELNCLIFCIFVSDRARSKKCVSFYFHKPHFISFALIIYPWLALVSHSMRRHSREKFRSQLPSLLATTLGARLPQLLVRLCV
jgi:hypothetical protein